MSKLLTAVAAVSLCATSIAWAQSPGASLLSSPPVTSARPPVAAAAKPASRSGGNPCAAFGPGFARVDGSGTCVKLGGALRVETGKSFGR